MDLRQYAAAQDFVDPGTPPAPTLAREQEQEAQNKERAAEVYKKYQENIKAAQGATTALRKGILAGDNPYRLLLLATDCIGRLTADSLFSEGARKDMILIYGEALGDPQARELELEELEARLDKLRQAQVDPDERGRINASIREHERRIAELS